MLKDDMAAVFEAVKTADIVLIASPIYIRHNRFKSNCNIARKGNKIK